MAALGLVILSLFTCALAFVVQIIIWKVRRPIRQSHAILAIFLGVLFVNLLGLTVFEDFHRLLPFPLTVTTCAQIAFVFLILLLCYLITYSAVEADSPTMLII